MTLNASTANSAARRLIGAGPGIGFTVFGAGMLALAAVEAGLLVQPSAPPRTGTVRNANLDSDSVERTPAIAPLGPREATQDAAPAVPERRGGIISITSDSTTLGVTIYRLWSSGRVEASVLGESNVWTDWVPVGPGLSGDALRPKKKPAE